MSIPINDKMISLVTFRTVFEPLLPFITSISANPDYSEVPLTYYGTRDKTLREPIYYWYFEIRTSEFMQFKGVVQPFVKSIEIPFDGRTTKCVFINDKYGELLNEMMLSFINQIPIDAIKPTPNYPKGH